MTRVHRYRRCIAAIASLLATSSLLAQSPEKPLDRQSESQSSLAYREMTDQHEKADLARNDVSQLDQALVHIRAARRAHLRLCVASIEWERPVSLRKAIGIFSMLNGPFAAIEGSMLNDLGRFSEAENELLTAEAAMKQTLEQPNVKGNLEAKIWQQLVATMIERSQAYSSMSQRSRSAQVLNDAYSKTLTVLQGFEITDKSVAEQWNATIEVLLLELAEEDLHCCRYDSAQGWIDTSKDYTQRSTNSLFRAELQLDLFLATGRYKEAVKFVDEVSAEKKSLETQGLHQVLRASLFRVRAFSHLWPTRQKGDVRRGDLAVSSRSDSSSTSLANSHSRGQRRKEKESLAGPQAASDLGKIEVRLGGIESQIDIHRERIAQLRRKNVATDLRHEQLTLAQLLVDAGQGSDRNHLSEEAILLVDQHWPPSVELPAASTLVESEIRDLLVSGSVMSRARQHERARALLQCAAKATKSAALSRLLPQPVLFRLQTEVQLACVDAALLGNSDQYAGDRRANTFSAKNSLEAAKVAAEQLVRSEGCQLPRELQLELARLEAVVALADDSQSHLRKKLIAAVRVFNNDICDRARFLPQSQCLSVTQPLRDLSQLLIHEQHSREMSAEHTYQYCRTIREVSRRALTITLNKTALPIHFSVNKSIEENTSPAPPKDSAVIELFGDGSRVVAFVIRRQDDTRIVTRVELPDLITTNRLQEHWHQAFAFGGFRESNIQQVQIQAYRKIWKPLQDEIGGATQVYIVSGGYLNELPWPALQQLDGCFLARKYQFSHIGSTKLLHDSWAPDKAAIRQPNRRMLFVSAPQFSREGKDKPFPPIPGTNRFTDSFAVPQKAKIDNLGGLEVVAPRVIEELSHAANSVWLAISHGNWDAVVDEGVPQLFRGQIAMAAANDNNNRSPLTAETIASTDLNHIRLTMLIICSGGVGYAVPDLGKFSFLEALELAGCETAITTRWDVDQQQGPDFAKLVLTRFFAGGMSIGDALQQAQVESLEKARGKAIWWAPFTLGGNLELTAKDCGFNP